MRDLPCNVRVVAATSAAAAVTTLVALLPDWLAATLGLAQARLALLTVLAASLLYLAYVAVSTYVGRIERERRRVQDLSHLHLEALEALASAIDAKDQLAPGHIRRVQHFATALAQRSGMSEPEVRGVQTAAMLHDIGKIAIPEQILSKPGPLTPAELQKVRTHPKLGADIVASIPFPYPVIPLILCHHERWDGKGYPAGLKGDDIPLGARILALADSFDVMMTERPYQPAATYEQAVSRLRDESGKAFDPNLVEQFLELLPSLRPSDVDQQAMALERPLIQVGADRPATRPVTAPKVRVFQDIALAHREIYALYEMAHAMGGSLGVADTMTLIASKLESLVPYDCCALFLHDDDSDTLTCRFATGTDADVVRQFVVPRGDGLIGRVATDRRSHLNGRPSADLEASGLLGTPLMLQSALVCPLMMNDQFIGAMVVYHVEDGHYTEDHRRLMDRVSEQASAVIFNSIRFERTKEDSLTDALTQLPNTRYLYMHLSQELARSRRERASVALLVIDLDDFKRINDTYGHHIGDRALKEVAAVLRAAIRPYDVCVRVGGDEFIVVLSNCGLEEADAKREEIQTAVEGVHFEARPGKRVQLGASIGLAISPQDGEVHESLLAAADRRMYGDKARRRTEEDVSDGRPHAVSA